MFTSHPRELAFSLTLPSPTTESIHGTSGILENIFTSLFGSCSPPKEGERDEDIPKYVNTLTGVISGFAGWPAEGKNWAASIFKDRDDFEGGRKALAQALCDDAQGHFGLTHKSTGFKARVRDACLLGDRFCEAVKEIADSFSEERK